MNHVSDLPSAIDLELLEGVLAERQLDRAEILRVLHLIHVGLQVHANELEYSGGPLNEREEVARPSLARKAEQLQDSIVSLTDQLGQLRERIDNHESDWMIRNQGSRLLEALKHQRNQEADIKLESITDIGGGD